MENINGKINIFGLNIDNADYGVLLSRIYICISQNSKMTIGYANANTLNNIYNNTSLTRKLNEFNVVHPDGVGVFTASRFLFGKNGLKKRINGSDFYPLLIEEALKRNWRFYFFGHDADTLSRIKEKHAKLIIAGCSEGFGFDTEKVIEEINRSDANILVIGLGFPLQEEWIYQNKERLRYNVIISVGDGIKVFAGTKTRGPIWLRRLGFEWLARLLTNPAKYLKRYIIGNPVFLYRIIRLKFTKFAVIIW